MEENDDLQKLSTLIKGIHIAMLSTIRDEKIHSRPMATSELGEDGSLWFFTRSHSEKVEEVEKNATACLTYADSHSNTYVAVVGKTELSQDRNKIHELWNPFVKAWFPNGPDDPEVSLLKFIPESAEYWDSSSNKMVVLFNMAKAALTGERYKEGEHGKFTLG